MSDYNSLAQVAEDTTQSSYRRRQAVSEILKDHGPGAETVSLIQKLLGDCDIHFKRDLVGAIKDNVSSELIPVVKPLLYEDDDYLKRDVIQLIGKVGTKEELALVEPLCEGASFSITYAAKQAVRDIEARIEFEHLLDETAEEEETVEVSEPESEPTEPVAESEPTEPVAESEPEESETADDQVEVSEPVTVPEEAAELELEQDEIAEPAESEPEEAAAEFKPVEPAESEPESKGVKEREDVKEIHPQKQKLPESLHDNSIFGEKSVSEVSTEYADGLTAEFSEIVPALNSGGSPDNSKNLKTFFGDQFQLALALYRQLNVSGSELPKKENALSNCRHRLTLLEADKADDLEQSEESVVEASKEKKDREWDVKKAEQAIINFEKENKELINSIMFMFSSAKKEEAEAKKASLQKELKKAKSKLSDESAELEGLVKESKSIQEPLLVLHNELKQLTDDRDTVLDKIYLVEKEINELITKTIVNAGEDEIRSRLKFLGDGAVASGIVHRIIRLSNTLKSHQSKRDSLRREFEKLQKDAAEQTDNLGIEMTKSLQVISSTKNEKVKIRASLTFKEEESFFSFSNASGSASGTGEATASVNVDEINWRESGGLKNTIKDFSGTYQQLGSKSAELEAAEIDVQTANSALSHYIDYIRCAVESDFE